MVFILGECYFVPICGMVYAKRNGLYSVCFWITVLSLLFDLLEGIRELVSDFVSLNLQVGTEFSLCG